MKLRLALAMGALAACLAGTGAAAAGMPADGPVTLQQLRAKYSQPGSKYMTIKGVEVHYMDEGKGPAILMIHGSNSNLKTYDKIAAALKGRYRVIRYDIPPGGLSGPVSDEAMKVLVPEEVPEILLTNLGIKTVTAVGVSSGGTTAMFFTARRPDMVERLIMSNSPSSPVEEARPKQSKALAEQIAATKDMPLKPRAFWNAFFDFFTGEPERMTPAMREEYFDMNRMDVKNRVGLVAKVVVQPVTRANAEKVKIPVLLVWGGARSAAARRRRRHPGGLSEERPDLQGADARRRPLPAAGVARAVRQDRRGLYRGGHAGEAQGAGSGGALTRRSMRQATNPAAPG